jgi:hypothetical protein
LERNQGNVSNHKVLHTAQLNSNDTVTHTHTHTHTLTLTHKHTHTHTHTHIHTHIHTQTCVYLCVLANSVMRDSRSCFLSLSLSHAHNAATKERVRETTKVRRD